MKLLSRNDHPRHLRHLVGLVLLILALVMTSTAGATQHELRGTFTGAIIGQMVRFERNGPKNEFAGVLALQLDNGPVLPVFCIQVDVLVRPSDRYVSDGPIYPRSDIQGGCQIRYLLDRYPASTATTREEAAARQMAIWHFTDGVDLNTITQPTAVRDRAIVLRDEAIAGTATSCPAIRSDVPELRLDPPAATVAAGQVISYTVSAGPGSAGQNVTVSVTGTAVLSNGQQQMAVTLDGQGNATFTVANASQGTSSVSVALPTQLDPGTVFTHELPNNETQLLVLAERYDFIATATVSATWGQPLPTPTVASPTTTIAPTMTPPATTTPLPIATPVPTSKPAPKPPPPPEETPTEVPATPTSAPDQPSGPGGPTDQSATQTPDASGGGAPGSTPQAGQPGSAGGAVPARPRTLPRTGGPADEAAGLGLAFAALLLACGWLIHRRGTRR